MGRSPSQVITGSGSGSGLGASAVYVTVSTAPETITAALCWPSDRPVAPAALNTNGTL